MPKVIIDGEKGTLEGQTLSMRGSNASFDDMVYPNICMFRTKNPEEVREDDCWNLDADDRANKPGTKLVKLPVMVVVDPAK